MKAGETEEGEAIDLVTAFSAVVKYNAGKFIEDRLTHIEQNACPTCGSCLACLPPIA